MIVAGYLDLPPSHKLALMKLCDSADDQTRIAYPGLDAVRLWAGTKKSRSLDVLRELQEAGLIVQIEQGNRGRRAEFKVFPEAGDDRMSLAYRRGKPCPGVDQFKGSPGIPNVEQIKARIAAVDGKPEAEYGSESLDPIERVRSGGPNEEGSDTLDPIGEEGSDRPDPIDGKGSDPASRKGPISTPNGSESLDPFGTNLRTTTSSINTSEADAPDPPTARPDVDQLCEHLADRIEGNGARRPTVTRMWRDAARLMLDRDDRTVEQVRRAIDWSQDHEFWRANILSMPTLRGKYDQLRLQAMRDSRPRGGSNLHTEQHTPDELAEWTQAFA